MLIRTKVDGKTQEHEIPTTVMALVHKQGIKVSAPNALTITPEDTLRCMREMSQKAWEHISTGPLFSYLFGLLFPEHGPLPTSIETFVEDSDEGVLHGAGLIVLMCEAQFASAPEIFLKTPETYLHPQNQAHLMTVILAMRKLRGAFPNSSCLILGD